MIDCLPQETINEIMSHLSNDRRSLIACSSASSKFTAAARRILFFEVVLECSSICCFLKLLDMPSCTIPPAMVRVVVRKKKKSPCVPAHPRAHYSPRNLPTLVTGLRGVRCVKLEDVSLDNIPPPFLSLLRDLEGVKELEIHRMSFDTPIEFFRYICTLPALEALSISKSSIEVAGVDIAPLRPRLPFCIPFLDVGKLSPGILKWFLGQDPIPPVHTFRINLNSSGEMTDVDVLHQFVDAMGPSIQNLQITLTHGAHSSARDARTPGFQDFFRSFSAIRTLHLETYLRLGEEHESYHFKGLMRTVLKELSSQILETISLTISLHIDETLLFFGFPDDLLLSIFDWGLSLKSSGTIRPHGVRLTLRGLPPFQRRFVEQALRKGPFVMFDGTLSIEFK